MVSANRVIVGGLAAVAVAVTLAACGGASSKTATSAGGPGGTGPAPESPARSEVVARVGATPITKTEVSHWMATLAGGDYYELSRKQTVPAGLVSDPADYPACVASLEAAKARAPVKAGPPVTGAQLLAKCQRLYQALRTQAVEFLVNMQWVIAVSRAMGVVASPAEAQGVLKETRASQGLVADSAFNQYLEQQRRSVSDELAVATLDVLYRKAHALTAHNPAELARFTAAGRSVTTQTSCSPGYVVQHCRQFTEAPPPSASSPSPAVLMEQVAAIATGRCVNRPACGQQ